MSKKGVIDRFEGRYAVVELFDKSIINIERILLPQEAREGDVIDIETYNIDKEETEKRKVEVNKMARYLFEE
ncbi:DUF3006 domain-containing protein [Thermovenabulum sp.]|uniref:DUF3006 domain-containing protein n=1 Tax=Thermovenabulum sp. TaxID=3100335 RepID=UPI003C7DA64E